VTTRVGSKFGVDPVGALAVGVVTVPLVGLMGANVELVALSLTVCVWPRASETENSNHPVKTKTETRLPQRHLDMILFLSPILHTSPSSSQDAKSAASTQDSEFQNLTQIRFHGLKDESE
jgi:hypothetical protein